MCLLLMHLLVRVGHLLHLNAVDVGGVRGSRLLQPELLSRLVTSFFHHYYLA